MANMSKRLQSGELFETSVSGQRRVGALNHRNMSTTLQPFAHFAVIRRSEAPPTANRGLEKAHHSAAVCSFSPYHVQNRVRNNSVHGGYEFQMVRDRYRYRNRYDKYKYIISIGI